MTSPLRRLFGKVVALREGEAATGVLMFGYSFLAMTSYTILKPISRFAGFASRRDRLR
jgi:hypothetical protein